MEREKHNIQLIINACKAGNRAGQRKLYQLYFSYGMSVALRYASNRAESEEILNEGFLKVFTKIDQYDEAFDSARRHDGFKKWFRKILINTSIDYYRKYKKLETYSLDNESIQEAESNVAWDNLLYQDILKYIQLLPPSYRIVFNMYAVDGLKHHEIAEQLNITVGSSKSNYSKARKHLQKYLKNSEEVNTIKHGG